MTARKAKAKKKQISLRDDSQKGKGKEEADPCGNDRKKGKGNNQYRGLSTAHHIKQERDAPVEMTEFW
jgi:hypothetical protein